MKETIKWFRKNYNKAIHGLLLFPALIMIGFLGLAIILLELDASGVGEKINEKVKWLTLKDANTASTIASTVASGIISIMVFSFSMVMVVMTQIASQMSNRMLDNLIGGRLQKCVLSFYIGTIMFAFVLLSNMGGGKDTPVPVLSTYFLILLAIADIFFFVSFLNYITQSIRYEQLVQTVHKKALGSLINFSEKRKAVGEEQSVTGTTQPSPQSGYYQGFNTEELLKICASENISLRFLHVKGEYVLKGTPLFVLQSDQQINEAVLRSIHETLDFYYGQEIDKNPYYGFLHLMEAGVKALSPGINDPGTAVLSLNALADLLAYKMEHQMPTVFCDAAGTPRIISKEVLFPELFERSVVPIWDYGRKDRRVQNAMLRLLHQLRILDSENKYSTLFDELKKDIMAAQGEMPFRPSTQAL
jgi:uncharacterized membrane protein